MFSAFYIIGVMVVTLVRAGVPRTPLGVGYNSEGMS